MYANILPGARPTSQARPISLPRQMAATTLFASPEAIPEGVPNTIQEAFVEEDRENILAEVSQDLHALDFIDLDSDDKLLVKIISSFDSKEKRLEVQTILTEALAEERYTLAKNLILCGAELSEENMESIEKSTQESQESQEYQKLIAAIEAQRDIREMEEDLTD